MTFLSRKSLAIFSVLVGLCGPAANAASQLDFPRLTGMPDIFTGLAIVNPNTEDAAVSLTAYSNEGQVLGIAEFTVEANQQFSRLTAELFPELSPDTVGWIGGFSMANDLTGFFLYLNSTITEFDGADLPKRARKIVFNRIEVGTEGATELNTVNPSPYDIDVQFTLFGPPEPVQQMVNLPAHGMLRADAEEFFGVNNLPEGSYVVASAGGDLVGFQVVRTGQGDVIGLNARSGSDVLNTLYFPQMAVLGPFMTRLGVVNYSNERSVILTVTAHKPDGELYVEETTQNPVTRALAPGESLETDLAELFGFSVENPQMFLEGWLEVVSTSETVNGYLSYETPVTGARSAVAPIARGNTRAIFSHLATSLDFFTGVAVLNAGAVVSNVRILALDREGQVLGSYTASLQPRTRISRLITELIPGAAGQSSGSIWVRSSTPVFASSLFGNVQGSVLSNIPPQPAPSLYRPDAGLPSPTVSPNQVLLEPGATRQFSVSGLGGEIIWSVNGVPGGSPTTGTIDQTGLYMAPDQIPVGLPIGVTASVMDTSAGATVDVLSQMVLVSGQGIVQSVAYLGGLQRLYTAELAAAGGLGANSPAAAPAQSSFSEIFEVSAPSNRNLIRQFSSEEISKILAFTGIDGQEYLLASGRLSGEILRLNPLTNQLSVVFDGLNAPESMVLDPVSGNLLVAEATQVTTIPLSALNMGLTSAARGPGALDPDLQPSTALLSPIAGIGGLAVDACTANIFLSETVTGRILEYVRTTGQIREVLSGLEQPGQMLALYRQGLTCPQSFHLLIVEGNNTVSLYIPADDILFRPWAETENVRDITFIPSDSPLVNGDSVVLAELLASLAGQISLVGVPGLYEDRAVNPPIIEVTPTDTTLPGPDISASNSATDPGNTATVNIFFRPGPESESPTGPDKIVALVFSIRYDATRLIFDPTDSNMDGIPDAVIPGVSPDFTVTVFFDQNESEGQINIVIADLSLPFSRLEEGNLLNLSFQTLPGTLGTADLVFSMTPVVSISDGAGVGYDLDEIANGSIVINP